jgi:hypothetical protein
MKAITLKTARKMRGTIPRIKVRKVVAAVYGSSSQAAEKKQRTQSKTLVGKTIPLAAAR